MPVILNTHICMYMCGINPWMQRYRGVPVFEVKEEEKDG